MTCGISFSDQSINAMYVRLQILISNTSGEHRCILSRKYFPIASVDRDKSEYDNDICFMAFALKAKVLRIVKEEVISTCGRGQYVM